MVLMKLHDSASEEAAPSSEPEPETEEKKQLFMSTLQKKKPKNADRNKALE